MSESTRRSCRSLREREKIKEREGSDRESGVKGDRGGRQTAGEGEGEVGRGR